LATFGSFHDVFDKVPFVKIRVGANTFQIVKHPGVKQFGVTLSGTLCDVFNTEDFPQNHSYLVVGQLIVPNRLVKEARLVKEVHTQFSLLDGAGWVYYNIVRFFLLFSVFQQYFLLLIF